MSSKLARLLAFILALAMLAAACGSSDSGDDAAEDDSSSSGGALSAEAEEEDEPEPEPEEEAMDEEEPEPEEEAMDEEEPEPEEEAMDEEEPAEEEPAEEEPAEEEPAGLADDSVDGLGAERLESVIIDPPGPADDSLEPVVITMANLEGDALGSFPEIREGLEIAVADINENWGGIGGRPIELEVCVHGFDPNAAINCGNEIAERQPNLNINGIEFFTPALWPTFLGAGIPTIQTVPIFVSDFTVEGNGLSPFGGCPVAFPSAAQYTMEILELEKVAVVYANTPPGLECYADTEERFWDYLVDNEVDGEYIGLPDNSGDPSDDDAVVQQIADFFGDTDPSQTAVFFGTQASDCNAIMSAISAAGLETQIIASGSCIDDSVLIDNPASTGAQFGNQSRIAERPDLYPGFPEWELNWRNDLLENSDIRTTPVSAFLRVGHTAGVFAWNMFNDMLDAGVDIDDSAAVIAWMNDLEDVHLIANNPITCTNNTPEFPSVCKKDNTFVTWGGPDVGWDPEGSPLGGEYFSVEDIQARVAAGNPRPEAGG